MVRQLFFILITTGYLIAGAAGAQESSKAAQSITDFRPVGDTRFWSFVVRDSAIGGLTSIVKERTAVDGRAGVVITQKLSLDYSPTGQDRKVQIEGEFYAGLNAVYLGDSKKLTLGDKTESLELRRVGDTIAGYFTRAGNRIGQKAAIKSNANAFDLNFYDELELILATRNLEVGQDLEANLFEPQSLLNSQLTGFVEDFTYMNIYGQNYDSVFLVNIFTPQNMFALFTRDKRLVKVDIPDQKTKVYLDLVRKKEQPTFTPPSFGLIQFIQLIPNYGIYLVISVIGVLLFIGRGYRWKTTYAAYAISMVSFWLMVFTQFPLQEWIFKEVFIPSLREGGSVYVAAILPSLPVGIIQTLICFGLVILVRKIGSVKDYQLVGLAAVIGAGFGYMEACYLDSLAVRTGFDIGMLERVAILVYHAAAGGFLGYILAYNRKLIWVALTGPVVINTFFRYAPVFVQGQAMSVGALAITMMGIAFLSQLSAFIIVKQRLFKSDLVSTSHQSGQPRNS